MRTIACACRESDDPSRAGIVNPIMASPPVSGSTPAAAAARMPAWPRTRSRSAPTS